MGRKRKFKLFPRYRKPSLSVIIGISQAKRQLRKNLGLSGVHRSSKWLSYKKQSIKRKYIPFWNTEAGRLFRFLNKEQKKVSSKMGGKYKKDFLVSPEITLSEDEEHYHGWVTIVAFTSNSRPTHLSDLIKLFQSELEQPGQLLGLNLLTEEVEVKR